VFLHCLQQRGLRFGWGAVDFVREKHLGKDGALLKHKISAASDWVLLQNVGAGDVGWHEVRCELNASEAQLHGEGEGANYGGFGEARNAFEQAVAAGKHRDKKLVNNLFLSDDKLSYFSAELSVHFDNEFSTLFIV
jgi:hypothetical protein